MSHMTISEVARQAGLRSSTIRYYEQIGVLQPAQRASGQRRYDNTVLYRLAIIQRAQQTGFTLDEVRKLFFGFREKTPISERWRKLSGQKLKELEQIYRVSENALKVRLFRARQRVLKAFAASQKSESKLAGTG